MGRGARLYDLALGCRGGDSPARHCRHGRAWPGHPAQEGM